MPSSFERQIPKGLWSRMMYDAIERSELLMLRVVKDMKSSWAVESDQLTLERLQWEKFSRMLEAADADPEAARALNEKLIPLITPLLEQAFAPPQTGQPPQPSQGGGH